MTSSTYHFINPDDGRKLAQYIGHLKDNSPSGVYFKTAEELINNNKVNELVTLFAKESGLLLSSSASLLDIEAAYKVLIVLIDDTSADILPDLVDFIIKPILADTKTGSTSQTNKTYLKTRILITLFNIISPDNALRYVVFNAVLDVVAASNDISLIKTQLAHIEQWIIQWKLSDDEKAILYKKLSDYLSEIDQESSFEWLVKYVTTEKGSKDSSALEKVVVKSISIPSHLRFVHLLNIPIIKKYLGYETENTFPPVLKSLKEKDVPDLYKLLDIFIRGTYSDYVTFAKEKKSFLDSLSGLKEEDNLFKIRILTIASIATSIELPGELEYSKIASTINVPEEEVEIWIINAIRAGLIDAKMDQLHKNSIITRAGYRQFSKNDWKLLEKKLKSINFFN